MKAQPTKIGALAALAAWVVYRDVSARARLLVEAFRGEGPTDSAIEESMAAYAEPAVLPEPLLRSKVS